MKLEDWIKRAEELKALADRTVSTRRSSAVAGIHFVDNELFVELRSSGLAFFRNCFGEDHPFYKQFDSEMGPGATPRNAEDGRAVLTAAINELKGGWLQTTQGLIAGNLFSDFLDMANHLLDENYKDAAAVIAGSSLEAHLRALCVKSSIDVIDTKGAHKKADLINAELHKAKIYALSEQKQVTAWLGIRNDAAHGDYAKVIAGSVKVMIDGIRHFMTIHPA